MVIIKKDDYLTFLNSTGVKMPTSPNSVNSVTTIKRDSSAQQLQQLQQYAESQQTQPSNQQQQNQNQTQAAGDSKSQVPLARAVLVCRPNSHPFSNRTLLLEPSKIVKIGRAIARTKASETNAIFDCKVLSRNHAELWYNEGKFFIKVSVFDECYYDLFQNKLNFRILEAVMVRLLTTSVLVKHVINRSHMRSVLGILYSLESMLWKIPGKKLMGVLWPL